MRHAILTCALLLGAASFAADDKPAQQQAPQNAESGKYFDKRIEAWAIGTVTGIQLDNAYIALEGQTSAQAVEYAQLVERALIDKASPPAERLKSLRAETVKMEKKEIILNYDKANPVPLMQCPVKVDQATKVQNVPAVQLADLKIGDTLLVGYDAEKKINQLYAAVAIEPTKNTNEDPVRAQPKE